MSTYKRMAMEWANFQQILTATDHGQQRAVPPRMSGIEKLLDSSQGESSEDDSVPFAKLHAESSYEIQAVLHPTTEERYEFTQEEPGKEQQKNLVNYLMTRVERALQWGCPSDMDIYYITQDMREKQLYCQQVLADEDHCTLGQRMVLYAMPQQQPYVLSRDCLCALRGCAIRTAQALHFYCSEVRNLCCPTPSPLPARLEGVEAIPKTLIKIKGPVLDADRPLEETLPEFVRRVKALMKTAGARQLVLQTPLWDQDRPHYISREEDNSGTSKRHSEDPILLTFTYLVTQLEGVGASVFLQPGLGCEFATPAYPQRFSHVLCQETLAACPHVRLLENPATVRVGEQELLFTDADWKAVGFMGNLFGRRDAQKVKEEPLVPVSPSSPSQRSGIVIKRLTSPVSLGPEPAAPRTQKASFVQRLFAEPGPEVRKAASKSLSLQDQLALSTRMIQFVVSAKTQHSVVCSLVAAKSGQVDECVNFQFQAADLAFPAQLPPLAVENEKEDERLVIGGSAPYPEATLWQVAGDRVRCQQVVLVE